MTTEQLHEHMGNEAALRQRLWRSRGLPDVLGAGPQLQERVRCIHEIYARPAGRRLVDRTVRSGRAILQLHVQGGLWLANYVACAPRCTRFDQSDGWPRELPEETGRIFHDTLPPEGYLP